MNDAPPPQPPLTQAQTAFRHMEGFRSLRENEGWRWFMATVDDELAKLAASILNDLAAGADRDAAIARYRTIKETMAKPARIAEGAKSVIAGLPKKDDLESGDVPRDELP